MYLDKSARLAYTEQASAIVSRMSLQEKIDLMTGNSNMDQLREGWRQTQNFSLYPYTSTGCEPHNIPPLRFSDGSRGAVCGANKSTCFPVTVCRGASFDPALEEEIGSAIAKELRAYGANLFGGVCVNLPYHPGWGRSQDVYGEDSFEMGQMASALIHGVQSEHVMACVKHYAFNSIENSRFIIDIDADPRAEREVFLSHFKDCIDAGAACVMGAFNKYQGDLCCESEYLLKKVLKEDWDFDGFVISDWFSAINDTKKAVKAGLDVEMPTPHYYGDTLLNMVRQKQISEEQIDDAALRIVRTVLAFENAWQNSAKHYGEEVLGCKAHANLALKAAREGITLLKNEGNVLQLSRLSTRKIAVLGKLAMSENLGDRSSQRVFPAHTVTPLDGISQLLPKTEIVYYGGENLFHAKRIAVEADAVVIVAGYSYADEGEYMTTLTSPEYRKCIGGDRSDLGLHPQDVELINTVGPLNKNTVVVMIGGSTIIPTPWIDNVPAVLMAYYPGQEGGTAIAEILFGKVNPSGKLPFVVPYRQEDLPEINWNTDKHHYDYYHGYAKLEKEGVTPLFPFGFGLSYTTFDVSDAVFSKDEQYIYASCNVKNSGNLSGETVIQMYAGFAHSQIDRPRKVLRGFQRVSLRPGEVKTVTIQCPIERLKYYDPESNRFRLEHMPHEVYIGTSCDEQDLLSGSIEL